LLEFAARSGAEDQNQVTAASAVAQTNPQRTKETI
jgi:hypothetical protein